MNKNIIFLVFNLLFYSSLSFAQIQFDWGQGIGGTGNDVGADICTDNYGNVYVVGYFENTVDFDPGPNTFNLTSTYGKDIFITKSNSNGDLIWAKKLGVTGNGEGRSIVVDSYGNIYTTGVFSSTIDNDPSTGVFNLSSAGNWDIFINKLDSNGNFVWAKRIGGSNADNSSTIVLDGDENVYVAGHFTGTVDFDPGSSIFNMSQTASGNGYIVKLSSIGNFIFAKKLGGPVLSIFVDRFNNMYTTGTFSLTADFDPGAGVYSLISNGESDIFYSKLDAYGNFVWAKGVGGTFTDGSFDMAVDDFGNVYSTGSFMGTVDFDPGPSNMSLTAWGGTSDIFINKLDSNGNYVWAKKIGGIDGEDWGISICLDQAGNVYSTGVITGGMDFDPGPGNYFLAGGNPWGWVSYLSKLSSNGDFIWAKTGVITSYGAFGNSICLDTFNNVYTTGYFFDIGDFDFSSTHFSVLAQGLNDIYVSKFFQNGVMGYVYNDINENCSKGSTEPGLLGKIGVINPGNIIIQTNSYGRWHAQTLPIGNYTITFDTNNWHATCPNPLIFSITNSNIITTTPNFGLKANFGFARGLIYNDLNNDCIKALSENGLNSRLGIINPGNIVVQTDSTGNWLSDTLNIGSYSLLVDTSGNWKVTCPTNINFNVIPYGVTDTIKKIGLINILPCSSPSVSVNMPFIRPCFSNQKIHIQACNTNLATGVLTNGYVKLELDTLVGLTSSSLPYTSLGNNVYSFDVGTLNPSQCVNFWVNTTVSCNAVLGQTLCIQANLYPADSCIFDAIPTPSVGGVSPCVLPWDKSSLSLDGWCQNDSIYFTVTNTGDFGNGDMQCYAPVRIYIDGVYTILDSLLLVGGQTYTYVFVGDGRTWRLEADQHPLHPGNSHPSATVELCGNAANWTTNLVNILPMDDANPVVDIYCGIVTGSYDPNDKTGYPLGVGTNHIVSPNGKLDYVIRFQNTGTDTAFTVIVRDTLDVDLDIFSVRSGVSSHGYSFKMYGSRIMEWKFNNIMLPDSTTDQIGSNGFVTFTVLQNPDLADGTEINNRVGIYFDFNDPIITNTTSHIIGTDQYSQQWTEQATISASVCDEAIINNFTYNQTGTYFQVVNDTLVTIDVTLNRNEVSITEEGCLNYTLNGQTYTQSGVFVQTLTNTFNCDSVVTLNLTINTVDTIVVLNGNDLSANLSSAVYQWINCDNGFSAISGEVNQSYSPNVNGNYAVVITENSCTDTSACVNVLLTGINPINNENLVQFYPNPTGEVLSMILNTTQELYIEIYSVGGKLMGSKIITKNTAFDVSKYSSGMYFITATNKEGNVFQSKFVKE